MKNSNHIIISSRNGFVIDELISSTDLYNLGLYKTVSLIEAHRALIMVPPTLLLIKKSMDAVSWFSETWGLPLMIRVDYTHLPDKKPLGGIPVLSIADAERVIDSIFQNRCYPIFHPHLSRFDDLYSAGVMLNRNSNYGQFEIVGQGFDASDLRLGVASPHEMFSCELDGDRIDNRRLIPADAYTRERAERNNRISLFQRYIKFVQKRGRLLSSLNCFKAQGNSVQDALIKIPSEYSPLPIGYLHELIQDAWIIRDMVLDRLPRSENYVASFSYIPNRGWTLWDIYGEWYKR